MKGEQYLTESAQYKLVYDRGGTWVNELVVMKALSNGLDRSRYGFSVSRRVGIAVIRNRTKRRMREVLRQMKLKAGWDIIFIMRPRVAGIKYSDLKHSVGMMLSRAGLLAEKYEESRP